jgi:exodeoxyribonuclease VII small subunit
MSAKKDDKTLQEQLNELEQLISWFEQEDIDLEEAIKKFEEGSKLAADIKDRLKEVENKITVLKQRFEA